MADPPPPPSALDPLDLRAKTTKSDDSDLQLAQQYSTKWASIVRPISWAVMVLLFLLMIIPFVMIWHFSSQVQVNIPAGAKPEEVAAIVKAANAATAAQDVKDMLDWAKTFLPSLVGFATAMIGYYFGIRSGASGQSTQGSSGPASGST
ncbi:MAG TPA: hypothetical protein VGP62_15110 [Bryobacteraceae bacterium]|jgi:hypothetical protein|nr:hypothetical protein [Bryobacteraceae bacterium]